MPYKYEDEKPRLFTEEGVDMLTKVRDNVRRLLGDAGAVREQEATRGVAGSSWTQLACLDYLVERGELRELTGPEVPGQHRVFVATSD